MKPVSHFNLVLYAFPVLYSVQRNVYLFPELHFTCLILGYTRIRPIHREKVIITYTASAVMVLNCVSGATEVAGFP